ncbi:MAG: alkaline phosphatase family protein [Fimbriimonadaceae bacterium]|nr:MAG: alkaline phosphatase family protein [Fimbriimonadaceae bacterium]
MVVLVTIDGVRPDAIQRAATPNLDRIARDGSYTWTAQSVDPSITIPAHHSIFRSVPPSVHGVTANETPTPTNPVPTLFEVAKAHDMKTGFFYNWPMIREVTSAASLDVSYGNANFNLSNGNERIIDFALQSASTEDFDLLYLYLGHTDWCGHEYGWMSDEQIEAISETDKALGHFVDAIVAMHQPVDFMIFADHGGHDHGHGTLMPEDMTIPIYLWGYRVMSGRTIKAPTSLLDIAPTAVHLLGIKAPAEWQGTIMGEAIKDTLQSAAFDHHQVFGLED